MAAERSGLPVLIAAAVPLFAVQVGRESLRFLSRRKRGVRAFRRTLLQNGMPRDQAARLAQAYHEAGSFRKILLGAVRRSGSAGTVSEP